ncbi:unnamed protein product, partial [Mycena citricolor]
DRDELGQSITCSSHVTRRRTRPASPCVLQVYIESRHYSSISIKSPTMPALPWDKEISKELDTIRSQTRAQLDCISRPVLLLCAFSVGSLTTICGAFAYNRYLRRIPNSDWITPDIFAKKRWVRGTVTSVGDSDNFRLYHTPAFGWSWPFKFRTVPSTAKGLKDKTLHIRIAGVDAPEVYLHRLFDHPHSLPEGGSFRSTISTVL